ncbi:MAG: hypothetical protein IKZ68_00515 [Bacilli bacterium]|nr:hypothetical protein [Bacilli bacterium]
MDSYIKWYDSLDKVVKIIFSIFFWFCFLYRLFILIEDKAKDTGRLVFFIINCIPGISFIVWVIDIAFAITKEKVPLSFDDLNDSEKKEDDVIDAEEEK